MDGRSLASVFLSLLFLSGCAGTSPPVLLNRVSPEYPTEAQEKGLEGKVRMTLLIAETGSVEVIRVVETSGHKVLDDAAVAYAQELKFDPARKRGRPTSVWLTWSVTFKPVSTYFQPRDYVIKIQDLFYEASRSTGAERESILQELINQHDYYARHITANPELNYNEYLAQFVATAVSVQWQALWIDWPLRFPVYHDFILRYPDSDKVPYARKQLRDYLVDDIYRIKDWARYEPDLREKSQSLLRPLFTYLTAEFSDSIPADLQSEARNY